MSSKGVFEELTEALVRVERKVDALAAGGAAGGGEQRMLSISSLARRYDLAHNSVKNLLFRMQSEGFNVQTCKMGNEWRVNGREFDRAFDEMCGEDFLRWRGGEI